MGIDVQGKNGKNCGWYQKMLEMNKMNATMKSATTTGNKKQKKIAIKYSKKRWNAPEKLRKGTIKMRKVHSKCAKYARMQSDDIRRENDKNGR